MQRWTTNMILFGYEICGETADEMTISWEKAGGWSREVAQTERNLCD